MKGLNKSDVIKQLMDLSYLAAMIAVDIEEDRAAGMERLQLEFEQLDDLLSQIDDQIANDNLIRLAEVRAMLAPRPTKYTPKMQKRQYVHNIPKTVQ
ncbi:hypothetical protein HF289_00500 [Acidithiobacillus ferrooxidans]|uniref:hypothetical protein n=1 Tax=Acidithiobacillus TaxID=119977 RepID=UPI001C06E2FE|nr:hypothetical protein [Acidithiobacillus ferrooxidans]MBU2809780.1 hypothetical protein [Acidithiobacillus ferrooxidans F221]MBU2855408.1 hypothetical protein [Acidithiobacillus ferrooxidans]MCR2830982.1 hypothetical protein [Acidithiobacillus ferrooxidans]